MSVLARDPRSLRFDRYVVDWALRSWELTPLRITAIYLLFGFSALYYSDVVLVRQFSDPLLGQLQALKGGVEIVLTGGLIYGLTTTKHVQVERTKETLDRQREELHVLHRVLRHNLRNDLNVVLGMASEIGREDHARERRRRMDVIQRTAKKMIRYTEQAARIRRVTAKNGHVTEVDLVESVPRIVENHPLVDDRVTVSLALPEFATVRTNHMFLEAIEELIGNAVSHNDSESPRVEIAVDPAEGPLHQVEIRVSDNGPGIPDRIVSILQQSESDQLSHLQGMGLWFVYWAVSESDGHMIIDENEDGGALVRVRVPLERIVSPGYLGTVIDRG